MQYFKTIDPWEAIAVAAKLNDGQVYKDGVTIRRVDVAHHGKNYYVPMADPKSWPDLPTVDYETMALDFEEI